MFRWACLVVAVVFLTFLGWVLNDLRLSVRQAAQTIEATGKTANEHLPAILDNARRISTTMALMATTATPMSAQSMMPDTCCSMWPAK